MDGERGDERGDVAREDVLGIDVLVEAGENEAGLDLTGDLILQRVAELERLAGVDPALSLGFLEACQIGIRDGVADDQLAPLRTFPIENVLERVDEAGQQAAPRPQDPERLAPYRMDVGDEQVGTRVKNEIEGPVAEGG